ncbi:SDR family NAD(P)-dependent oxidoreductase [Persicirhabdus sediminis]|uniref:SDR family oxidoreductase n=1 Tax=Persicirhabdus sediminis TaxID=454144 RepID=A0A8J7SK13_9BACT|nr:SDR family oxidoreductase [Persicirhabdus sediminis]MBK1791456.1 SDR family oxidoreductase [Persicirhabdus sediminis]
MDFLESIFGLKGKTAVVIGGTGDLCGRMGIALARAGAEVILVGRNPENAFEKLAEIDAFDGNAWFCKADTSSREDLEQLLARVVDRSGKVDILINGASANIITPFLETTEDELENMLNVNYKSVFRACQIFGRYFVDRGEPASIINVGSLSGLRPVSWAFNYSAAKAAVHNLTKNLAREWADQEIRVNTLVPGFFPNPENQNKIDESRALAILRRTPMSRFGSAEELTGAILMLASRSAGGFITGEEIVVDGGYSSLSI